MRLVAVLAVGLGLFGVRGAGVATLAPLPVLTALPVAAVGSGVVVALIVVARAGLSLLGRATLSLTRRGVSRLDTIIAASLIGELVAHVVDRGQVAATDLSSVLTRVAWVGLLDGHEKVVYIHLVSACTRTIADSFNPGKTSLILVNELSGRLVFMGAKVGVVCDDSALIHKALVLVSPEDGVKDAANGVVAHHRGFKHLLGDGIEHGELKSS
jgi:hypothetical protein